MSNLSYEAKDFKVGDPIDGKVAAQIKSLQKVFGSSEDDNLREAYIQLQGATPWIKMQSGVRLNQEKADELYTGPGDVLAKAYVLFGMNYTSTKKEGYFPDRSEYYERIKNIPGYFSRSDHNERPKAGITGMSISSHNRFGSLRTATISFQVWTKSDMDAYEVLYMRPGMTVLLEWGHSLVLDGDEVSPADVGIDYFDGENRITKITQKIHEHREKQKYGYDGIVGIVKNFSWKFRPDGGYDCQVSLVTAGDLIESYKANFLLSQKQIEIEFEEAMNAYLSGSNTTVNPQFPSTQFDDDTPFDSVGTVPPVYNLYKKFCDTTDTALLNLGNIIEDMYNRLTDVEKYDFLEKEFALGAGPRDTPDLEKMRTNLEEVIKFLSNLQLAKGGLEVVEIDRYVAARWGEYGFNVSNFYGYFKVGTEKINIQSEWQEGIVDLNCGNNDLVNGQIEQGYVALVMPYFRDRVEEFTKYIKGSITADNRDLLSIPSWIPSASNLKRNSDTSGWMGRILRFLDTIIIQEGSREVQVFKLDPDWAVSTDSVIPISSEASRDKLLSLAGLRPGDGLVTYKKGYHTYGGAPLDNVEKALAPIELKKERNISLFKRDPKFRDEAYYFEGRYNNYSDTDSKIYRPGYDQFNIKSVHFGRILFTGYEAVLNYGGVAGLTAAVDQNFNPTGEQIIDPNDTYLSKLHLYLRNRLYNPYSAAHLKYSFIGKTFQDVFQYREVYPTTGGITPGAIVNLFGSTINGPTTRIDNLKRYDNARYNTYQKQLKSWNLLLGGRFIPHNGDPGYNVVYIKLGALLELLNRHVLRSDSSYFFLFKTMYKNAKSTHLYRTMDDHISADPEICILPHQVQSLGIIGRSGKTYLQDKDAPIILNIELSIDFVLQTLSKYIDDQGQVTTLTFIQEILDEVSRVTGGINSLQLQYREDSGLFHVVDRNQVSPVGKSDYEQVELNVFGLGSIIRNINMVSKITPKLTSMIAISAQDSAFTSTQDSTGFGALNRGITDRLFGERYDEDKKEKENAASTYDDLRKNLLEDLVGLKAYLADYYYGITIPRVGKDTQPGIYQNYCNFLFGADSKYRRGGRPSYNFIIPFQVELELYGISGIQVMDAFILSKEVLPQTYGGRKDSPVAFLVTGVEHKVGQDGWTTLLKTQIFNIDEKTPTREYPKVDDIILSDLSDFYAGPVQVSITPYDDMTASQKSTIHYLYKTCIDYGLNDMQARAVLGVCSKETGFVPKMEDSYGNTSFTRLREIWSRFNQPPYATIDGTVLVKDHWPNEADFWDLVYQGRNGNDDPGDAFKYRGAGLNQITGKDNYTKVQQLYAAAGSPQGTIDILSDPSTLNLPAGDGVYKVASHIAALWFKSGARLTTGTQDQITVDIFQVNAGRGTNLNNASTAQGLAKTRKFVASLPATIPAP